MWLCPSQSHLRKLQQQRGHLAVTWNLGTNAVVDFFYFWCCVELTQLCQLLNFDIAVEVL
jgi:hypothetical protein